MQVEAEKQRKLKASSVSSDDKSTDSSSNSSDNEPIYKLRRRNQVNQVSYRFNDYDDLINSAIKKDLKEKDEWNFEEPASVCEKNVEKLDDTNVSTTAAEAAEGVKKQEDSASDDSIAEQKMKKALKSKSSRKNKKKSKRKLNQLDISSNDTDSDESFKGSSESESDESVSADSESSLEAGFKRRSKSRRYATRRRNDKRFICDDAETDSDVPLSRSKSKKKKELDSDEFEPESSLTDEESVDVNSDELCSSTGSSTNSEYRWSKRKKKSRAPSNKPPRKPSAIKKKLHDEEDVPYTGSIRKKTQVSTESNGRETHFFLLIHILLNRKQIKKNQNQVGVKEQILLYKHAKHVAVRRNFSLTYSKANQTMELGPVLGVQTRLPRNVKSL